MKPIQFTLIFLLACNPNPSEDLGATSSNLFSYDLENPVSSITLGNDLREVSGIAFSDSSSLVAVEDENGIFYFIDPDNGKTANIERFTGDGDFEDLAVSDKIFWALRADGTLFRVDRRKGKDSTREFDTPLSDYNDVEGMCIHPKSGEIWIISKEDQGLDGKSTDGKVVYAFNPDNGDFKVAFRIGEKDIMKTMDELKRDGKFKPSAIALSPRDSSILILSAHAGVLIEVNSKGKVMGGAIIPKTLPKAEGLAFDEKDRLWISSEGEDGPGIIQVFEHSTHD